MDLLHISQTIKETRLRQKMTIAQIAQKAGLSKGFVSRLENFRITPSLNALNKIAQALGISMADLFLVDKRPPEYLFGRLDDGEEIIRDNSDKFGMRYFSLAYKKLDRKLDPFLIEYYPRAEKREFLMHQADEFFLLLEGKLNFFIFDETNCRTLTKGDTVYLSRNIPHTVRLCPGQKCAKALIIYREEDEE
jgi:transcriptional regulator with XRE-family HTH domain